jgi:hypothetical protein
MVDLLFGVPHYMYDIYDMYGMDWYWLMLGRYAKRITSSFHEIYWILHVDSLEKLTLCELENGPVEIDDLSMKSGWIFHICIG